MLGGLAATVYGNPSERVTVIGITGTSGKTTTTYLVEAGLRAAGRMVGLIGTIGIRIDGADIPSALTTPEAPALQAMLAAMAERGVDTVVMEVSSHALTLGRVDGTGSRWADSPTCPATTSTFTPPWPTTSRPRRCCSTRTRRCAPARPWCASTTTPGARWPPGPVTRSPSAPPDQPAHWRALDVAPMGAGGQEFTVVDPAGVHHRIGIRLPGHYNVANCLVALAILDAVGVSPEQASPGLRQTRVPGRLEEIDRGQDFLALVDYAHKPGALRAVLTTLRGRAAGWRWCSAPAAIATRASGRRWARSPPSWPIWSSSPTTTRAARIPAAIRREILAGAAAAGGCRRRWSRSATGAAAIGHAVAWAGPGDVVLIAGKGHETGQRGAGGGPPVRRPGRAGPGAGPWRRAPMIDLTVAQIAEIVGGTLADISPEAAAATPRHRDRRIRLARRRSRAGCSWRCREPAPTGTTTRRRRWRPARSPCWPPGRSASPPSWSAPEGPRAEGGLAGVLEHDADGSGAAVLAALAKLAAAVAAELVAGGLTHHRDHRLVGQDLDQGPGGRRARAAGRGGGPARVVQQRAGSSLDGAARDRRTDYLVLEMSARHPGNIAALAAIAPPAIGVVLNVGTAHLGEFGSREAIARTKSELPQAVPASGVVILNVDDPAVAAMAEVTAARVVRVSRTRCGRATCGPDR